MAKAKKNAPVKLSPKQLEDLKDAIIAGDAPKSIHERLGVSIANIHYHKAALKKKGLLNGSPVQKTASVEKNENSKQKIKRTSNVPVATPKEISKSKPFKLIVSGISIRIEGAASVAVGEDYIQIDY